MSWLSVLVFLAIFAAPWLIADLVTYARKAHSARSHARRGTLLGRASRSVPRGRARGSGARCFHAPASLEEWVGMGQRAKWDDETERRVRESLR